MAKQDAKPAEEKAPEASENKVQAQDVEFTSATEGGGTGAASSLDILLDMDIPVTVAVGQTEISVEELLKLSPGSVIKLDKPISEPVDLYIKDTKFATGQVVVVEDKFAIKIRDILGAAADVAPETN